MELITYRSFYGKNYTEKFVQSDLGKNLNKNEGNAMIKLPLDDMIL